MLRHNFVRIGFGKPGTKSKSDAWSCEVVLDPWMEGSPIGYSYGMGTVRRQYHRWNHWIIPEYDDPETLGFGKRWNPITRQWEPWPGWYRRWWSKWFPIE